MSRITEISPALRNWLGKSQKLFIDGKWCEGSQGQTFPTINPATEDILTQVAVANTEEVDQAVRGARQSFKDGRWSLKTYSERAEVLKKVGDLILSHQNDLAVLETLDTGKPIGETKNGDIPRSANNFHFFSNLDPKDNELPFPNSPTGANHHAVREPLGVVALVTPWNLPLYLETWKLAPALLMGNSVILKPSELTPLTASYLMTLLQEAGIPDGVVQLVQGHGERSTGEFLVTHSDINAISFTGETRTGQAIMKSASQGPTKVSFELGGKGASIFFEDAPWETALDSAVSAAFRNQGQICLATPRFYVPRNRWDWFLEHFLARVEKIKVGNPLDEDTKMGALVSLEHRNKVEGYLKQVAGEGKVVYGGDRPLNQGYFLNPTVITGLGENHPITREEIFGPVVSIYPFDSEDEVIRLVNSTPYGLSCSVWTNDKQRADRVVKQVKMGLVWVNCWFVRDLRVPFGGQKKSGIGREGGRWSLEFFSEWKSICEMT